jgi:tetratricopeptide (TPR) repeat protein
LHAHRKDTFFVLKTVLPRNLIAHYPVPEGLVWFKSPFVWAILATLGVSAGVFRLAQRWPGLPAAWLSYLLILAPNLGPDRIGQLAAADRYSYMATMGGVALLAGLLCRIWLWCRRSWPAAMGLTTLGLGVLLVLMVMSQGQCQTWRTSETLWTHVLNHGGSRSPVAHNNLGLIRLDQGRIEEARAEIAEALQLSPRYADAHGNLGVILTAQGRLDEAIAHYNELLRLKPDSADAHFNLGVVLVRQRRLDDAVVQFTEAVRLNRGDADAHERLAEALTQRGQLAEALAHYGAARRLKPNNAGVLTSLARIWATAPHAMFRDGRKAVESATRACELTGWKNAVVLDTYAAACAELGDFDRAVVCQARASELVTGEKQKDDFRSRLRLYQAHQPYRLGVGAR